ncbi:MAG TPA: type II secretion system F family protein [Marmoricola sp.]|nr:type II secretion system F family protein [Marmoricola sp.]
MSWLVAGCAIVAVLLLLPVRPQVDPPAARVEAVPQASLLVRLRPVLVAGAGAGTWAVLGGIAGLVGGCVAAAVVWRVLGRTEDPAVVRRRQQLVADLPLGVDLLATCLDAGAAPESSFARVAEAIGGPVGEELLGVHHRLAVGVDPAEVWAGLSRHPQLGPLGRAVGRAHDTGASVADAVHRLADELADRGRAEVEERARSIEVRAAAPLGLCLLPAFMVLGVVPMVVAVFGAMELFG